MEFKLRSRWPENGFKVQTLEDVLNQVPEGWWNLLTEGFTKMFDLGWDGEIIQIKEKFGSLRIYTPPNLPSEISLIISSMEHRTGSICCKCGKPSTHVSMGWIMNYCSEHAPEGSKPNDDHPMTQVRKFMHESSKNI